MTSNETLDAELLFLNRDFRYIRGSPINTKSYYNHEPKNTYLCIYNKNATMNIKVELFIIRQTLLTVLHNLPREIRDALKP